MSLRAEPVNAIAAIDASIIDMRAAGCTGTVESLLAARAALLELLDAADWASRTHVRSDMGHGKLVRLRAALARARGDA